MNNLERTVHRIVGDFPFIRIPLVYLYQRCLSFIPVKNSQKSEITVTPGHFFGFHDKCPWSFDDKYIVSHKFDHTLPISLTEKRPVEIGIFSQDAYEARDFKPLAKTYAWNWQQGASAQWLGKTYNIIFNDISDIQCVAKIIDREGTIDKIIPSHIANVTCNGKFGFSYSFSRLGKGMAGYGYQFNKKLHTQELSNTSLNRFDLESDNSIELFELEEFAASNFEESMRGAFSFFTHCNSSPDSKRFSFLHRWIDKYQRLQTRMYSANIDGGNLIKLPLEDCSHIAWYDNNKILAYCKPLGKDFDYYLIDYVKATTEKLMASLVSSDGHPQVSTDCRYVLTDTYPDRLRRQKLKLFDVKSSREFELASLRIPFKYRLEQRCDFHPRLNRSNSMICFDSAHSGVRSLCLMKNNFQL